MVDKSQLTQYNWWGNENEPPEYLKSKTQVLKLGFKPIAPVAFIESEKQIIYLYDLSNPESAISKNKNKRNPIRVYDQLKSSQSSSSGSPKESGAASNFSEIPPILSEEEKEELLNKKFSASVEYVFFAAVFLGFFLTGGLGGITFSLIPMLWSMYRSKTSIKMGRQYSFAIRQDTEYRTCDFIKKKLTRPDMKLYSIHDNNYAPIDSSRTSEIILHLPPDLVFLISVRSIISITGKTTKIYYNPTFDDFRYIKGKARNQKFDVDPIKSSHERAKWLQEHYPELVPREPIQIVIFANSPNGTPIEISHHPNTPMKFFGKTKFIFHKGVYLIEEKKIITLIKLLTPKPETLSSTKNQNQP